MSLGPWLARRRQLDRTFARRRTPLRRRLDGLHLLIAAVLVLVAGGTGALALMVGQRAGWFDPAVVEAVVDERRATNVFPPPDNAPFFDLARDQAGGALYLARQDGQVHRLDLATRLWSELPSAASSFATLRHPFVQFQRGCGGMAGDPDGCRARDDLWLVGAEGALLRYDGRRWQALSDDTRMLDAVGRPVDGASLVAGAVSEDSRWALLVARAGALRAAGLYDGQRRRWVTVAGADQAALSQGDITRIRWADGRFVLATASGLLFAAPSDQGLETYADEARTGRILDLAIDPQGRLLVLEDRACPDAEGRRCLRVTRQDPGSPGLDVLLDERARIEGLSGQALSHAALLPGGRLRLAGAAGVHDYDPTHRRWTSHISAPVVDALSLEDGSFFAITATEGVVIDAAGETLHRRPVTGAPLTQALLAADGTPLALTERGGIWRFDPAQASAQSLHRDSRLTWGAGRFTVAAGDTEWLILMGPENAVAAINMRRRSYRDLGVGDALPPWVTDLEQRRVVSGDRLYGFGANANTAQGEVSGGALRLSSLSEPVVDNLGLTPAVPAPLRFARPWSNGAVAVGDASGSVSVLRPSPAGDVPPEPLVGAGLTGGLSLNGASDILAGVGGLVLAHPQGVALYDMASRGWIWQATPSEGLGAVTKLAEAAGRLYALHSQRLLTRLPTFEPVIGGGLRPGIALDQLSDATGDDVTLTLAGGGRVATYDLMARQFTDAYDLGDQGDVRLLGTSEGRPIALSNGQLFAGSEPMRSPLPPVRDATVEGGQIWAVRGEDSGPAVLEVRAVTGPAAASPRCLFAQPSLATSRLLDARSLSAGLIAVLAEPGGLAFYDRAARRWWTSQPVIQGERLALTDSHLVVIEGESGEEAAFTLIPRNSLVPPVDTCRQGPMPVRGERTPVAGVAVREADPAQDDPGAILWVEPQGGRVLSRTGNSRTVLLDPHIGPDKAPMLNSLRRVYGLPGGALLFTTQSGTVWRYDPPRRQWSRSDPDLGGAAVLEAVIEGAEEGRPVLSLLVSGRGGMAYPVDPETGTLGRGTALSPPRVPSLGVGGPVRDAAMHLGRWAFLFDRSVYLLDPDTGSWRASLTFDTPDASRHLATLGGVTVLVEEDGAVWRIPLSPDPARPVASLTQSLAIRRQEGETLALGNDGHLYRLEATGALSRCRLSLQGARCESLAPPAPLLDPEEVKAAWPLGRGGFGVDGGATVLSLDTGLGILRTGASRVQRIQGLEAQGGVAQVQPWSPDAAQPTGLLIRLQAGALLYLGADGTVQGMARTTGAIRIDAQDRLWAWIDGRWRVRQQGGFIAAEDGVADLGTPIVALGIADAQAPLALTADRRLVPLGATGAEPSLGQLPATLDPVQVTGLVRDPDGLAVWVQQGEAVVRYAPGPCAEGQDGSCYTPGQRLTLPRPAPSALDQQRDAPEDQPSATVEGIPAALLGVVDGGDGTWTLWSEQGVFEAPQGQESAMAVASAKPVPTAPGQAPETWDDLRPLLRPRGDGQMAVAPLTAFDLRPGEGLRAVGEGIDLSLAPGGGIDPQPWAPLEAPWVRFDRTARQMLLLPQDGADPVPVPSGSFFQDGVIPPSRAALPVALDGSRMLYVTRLGVWQADSYRPGLRDLRFQPLGLTGAVTVAHGALRSADEVLFRWRPDPAEVSPDERRVTLDRLLFVEKPGQGGVTVLVEQQGQRRPLAPTQVGLPTDDIRDVGWVEQTPVLLSPLGVSAAQSHAPQGTAGEARATRLDQHPALGLVWRLPEEARQVSPGKPVGAWPAVEASRLSQWIAVEEPLWQWQRGDRGLSVVARDPARQGLRLEQQGQGRIGFAADRLVRAIPDGNGAVLMVTAATQERHDVRDPGVGNLGGGLSADHPAISPAAPLPIARWQRLTPRPGAQPVVVAELGGNTLVYWDSQAGAFGPWRDQPANPLEDRVLAESGPLTVLRTDGRPEIRLRVESVIPDGEGGFERAPAQVRVPLSVEGFPFDQVQDVESHAGLLTVATDLGLSVYHPSRGLGLGQALGHRVIQDERRRALRIRDLSTPLGTRSLRVLGVGADGRTVAHCSLFDDEQGLRACPDGMAEQPADRGSTPLWRWSRDRGGRVYGVFQAEGASGLPVEMVSGAGEGLRFAHDTLADVALCGDRAASLWAGSPHVMLHAPGQGLGLDAAVALHAVAGGPPERLICVEAGGVVDGVLTLAGDGLRPGHYLLGQTGAVIGLTAEGLIPVEDEALADLLRDPREGAAWRGGHWRAFAPHDQAEAEAQGRGQGRGQGALRIDLRASDGQWLEIPFVQGRLATDASRSAQLVAGDRGGRLWTASPLGLRRLQLRAAGLEADPLEAPVVGYPDAACRQAAELTRLEGQPILACPGAAPTDPPRLWSLPGLEPVDGDQSPFTNRMLVPASDRQPLSVRQEARRVGRPGRLGFLLGRDAATALPVGLSDGRFSFDDIQALAALPQGGLLTATRSMGLLQSTGETLDLEDLRRPRDPTVADFPATTLALDRVRRTGEATAEEVLCLFDGERALLTTPALDPLPGLREGCWAEAGRQGLWTFRQRVGQGGGPAFVMETARDGLIMPRRTMIEGAFTDTRALSAPLTVEREGEDQILVPTAAGIVALSDRGEPLSLSRYGVGPSDQPQALGLMGGSIRVLLQGRLDGLDTVLSEAPDLRAVLPSDLTSLRLSPAGAEGLRVHGRGVDGVWRHWALVDGEVGPPNSLAFDPVAGPAVRRAALDQPSLLSDAAAALVRSSTGVQVLARGGAIQGACALAIPDLTGPLLSEAMAGSSLFVLSAQALWEVSLDQAALAVLANRCQEGQP